MQKKIYSRQIELEKGLNFRDMGGYHVNSGRMLAWRRLFRSGELRHITGNDIIRLKEEFHLKTIIDLRNQIQGTRATGSVDELEVKYCNIPLDIFPMNNSKDYEKERQLFWSFSNSGEVYRYRIRQPEFVRGIISALQIIAGPENLPLVFHCNAGKDRTGVLAAIILGVLGAAEEDIIRDYVLTDAYMEEFIDRWNKDPTTAEVHQNLPEYQLKAAPESMALFLSAVKQEYGSMAGWLQAQGTDGNLVKSLEKALLV
jgi:protein-tyrosine phosphatase